MALLILIAALWIAVLAPGLYKRFSQGRPTESIDDFHYQLHLLERTGPKLVAPAYRLESVEPGGRDASQGLPTVSSKPGIGTLVLLPPPVGSQRLGTSGGADSPSDPFSNPSSFSQQGTGDMARWDADRPRLVARSADPIRRQLARSRRRNVVGTMFGLFIFTGLLGTVHSLRIMWVVTAMTGLALCAYGALVTYAQRLTLENRRHAAVASEIGQRWDATRSDIAAARARAMPSGSAADIVFANRTIGTRQVDEPEPRQAVAAR